MNIVLFSQVNNFDYYTSSGLKSPMQHFDKLVGGIYLFTAHIPAKCCDILCIYLAIKFAVFKLL